AARVLASALPRPAPALRTTISPQLQRAAVLALGGLYGGVVALAPATGEILAVAGIGLDGLQPPGSTFKIITLSGVLAAGIASPHSTFAYATALEMAIAAATVADGGRRPQPTYELGRPPARAPRALSATVARTVRRLMVGVVRGGTGAAAAIPGVVVAGKTGTAELKNECSAAGSSGSASESSAGEAASESSAGQTQEAHSGGCQGAASDPSNTDAWFAAF